VEGREREGLKLLLNQGPSEPCYATDSDILPLPTWAKVAQCGQTPLLTQLLMSSFTMLNKGVWLLFFI